MNILVTGKNGQLGRCMLDSSKIDEENTYFFYDRENLDITNTDNVVEVFKKVKPDIVINCAAYTDVKNAENEKVKAYNINADGVVNLVKICREYDCYLLHISTDFVFDGCKRIPYKEEDKTRPINVYGSTKNEGEKLALSYKKSVIIRTSWLYSEYGKNFYKTILNRVTWREKTNVVNDQIGCPTYAKDLSNFIVQILIKNKQIFDKSGIYHFSNNGEASWYDFATAIETLKLNFSKKYEPIRKGGSWIVDFTIEPQRYIYPISTKEFGDKVKRPKYSVLDNKKVETTFNIKNNHWLSSLVRCMKNDGEI